MNKTFPFVKVQNTLYPPDRDIWGKCTQARYAIALTSPCTNVGPKPGSQETLQ